MQKNKKSLRFQSEWKYFKPLLRSCLASNAPTEIMIRTTLNRLRIERISLPNFSSSDRLRNVEEIKINPNSVNEKPRMML